MREIAFEETIPHALTHAVAKERVGDLIPLFRKRFPRELSTSPRVQWFRDTLHFHFLVYSYSYFIWGSILIEPDRVTYALHGPEGADLFLRRCNEGIRADLDILLGNAWISNG